MRPAVFVVCKGHEVGEKKNRFGNGNCGWTGGKVGVVAVGGDGLVWIGFGTRERAVLAVTAIPINNRRHGAVTAVGTEIPLYEQLGPH